MYRHMLPGDTEAGRLVAVEIWCAQDQAKAWKAVAANQQINPGKYDGSVIDKNLALASKLSLIMTPSIVRGRTSVRWNAFCG
jgi:protein-disulfide isomerase